MTLVLGEPHTHSALQLFSPHTLAVKSLESPFHPDALECQLIIELKRVYAVDLVK